MASHGAPLLGMMVLDAPPAPRVFMFPAKGLSRLLRLLRFSLSFLRSYSASFSAALALWPFASLALTLPILAILYHRDGRLRVWSAIGSYIVVFYLLGLACMTVYPLPDGTSGLGITYGTTPGLNPLRFLSVIRHPTGFGVFELTANIALFVPLGFIVARGLGWGPVRSVLAGFAVSLLIETTQLTGDWGLYPYAYRTFDVEDLLMNSVGAFVGWMGAAALGHFAPRRIDPEALVPTRRPGLLRRTVAFVLDVVLAWAAALAFMALAQFVLRRYLQEWRYFAPALTLVSGWSVRASLLFFELLVPLARGGRTLGGGFVRMTCETRPRRGVLRLAFLSLRFATLCAVLAWPIPAAVACVLWWPVFRKMPYDLLPASEG